MKKKIALIFVTLMIVLSVGLTGCSTGSGITQAQLDTLNAQLTNAQAQLATAQTALTRTDAEKAGVQADLQKAQASVTVLQKQIDDLKAQYATSGATTLDTVKKLVKAYTDNHFYIKDVWDCNNYACDFWDILMQVGINTKTHPAVIVVGDKDNDITDILQSVHAWVLIDLGDGQKIVADPTAGYVITKAENPRYYKGWAFGNPADLKANDDLRASYNTTVAYVNALVLEINAAQGRYNTTFSQEDLAVYNKLMEIKKAQQAILVSVKAQLESLATKL